MIAIYRTKCFLFLLAITACMKKTYIILLILALGCGACATHGKHKNGKIKPGKAIPCPQKDC